MNDILPEKSYFWQKLENTVKTILAQYGYEEIRMPIIESTSLFCRSIGEVTDIVEKEMYTFGDGVKGEMVSLRPEGTASCVRACVQNGLLHNQVQRLWYMGPMFRRERPQKGRYRQFHQVGVEVFGLPGPDVDVEVILMTWRLWQALGLAKRVELQINSLGTAEERQIYRAELVAYLKLHESSLDEDSLRRLETNPLRVLDTKNPAMADIVANAPKLLDFLEAESKAHFEMILQRLDQQGVQYVVNPQLVRGLDYYTNTVFEWVTTDLGAQGTVCAGGRYDGLVQQLGGKASPAVGFAMGMERLVLLLEQDQTGENESPVDVYLVALGDRASAQAIELAEQLRDSVPSLRLLMNCGGGSFKSQFKKADKSGAKYALVLADEEIDQSKVRVKALRTDEEQQLVSWAELSALLQTKLG
jgi:histidyl-tRNA synthetase